MGHNIPLNVLTEFIILAGGTPFSERCPPGSLIFSALLWNLYFHQRTSALWFISSFHPFLPAAIFLYCTSSRKENNKDLLSFSLSVTACRVLSTLYYSYYGKGGERISLCSTFFSVSDFILPFAFMHEQPFL